jgi:proline dehydrogenase
MLRKTLLYLSNQQKVFTFVRRNRLARRMAARFVAGETVDEAMAAVRALNARGITASLDLLGESVHREDEARATARAYLDILDRINANKLDANVSLKLTAMGLDVSEELCVANVQMVLERAQQYDSFVRLDMESSAYTDRTLHIFEHRLYPSYPKNVGIVLQSYLRRTAADVELANRLGCRVRICKGAYQEPPSVAFPDKRDVDENYVRCMRLLMSEGNYPGIATHDERILAEAKRFAAEKGIATDRYEFQMLYGVRRDLQDRLVRDGYRMRVYVPFGTQWYPYLMRRLAERPANVAFMTGNVVKEMRRGRWHVRPIPSTRSFARRREHGRRLRGSACEARRVRGIGWHVVQRRDRRRRNGDCRSTLWRVPPVHAVAAYRGAGHRGSPRDRLPRLRCERGRRSRECGRDDAH